MIKPEYAVTADGKKLNAGTITDSYIKAVNINKSIIVNAQAAQMSLYEVCKGLKEMRDGKLYKELGYQNFEEYCEKETGIRYRHACRYITIFERLNNNINLMSLGTQIGVSSHEILPFWKDSEHTVLDCAVRLYQVETYEGMEFFQMKLLSVYTRG